jgi:hypothetical protein
MKLIYDQFDENIFDNIYWKILGIHYYPKLLLSFYFESILDIRNKLMEELRN